MESLIFALNAVLPIILMVSIGYFLKRIGFMSESFAKAANKLVFRFFLPATLFLNVYRIDNLRDMEFGFILYVLIAMVAIFLISIPAVILIVKNAERRGVVLQAIFRSNYALIGIPLAQSLFGGEGIVVATLLSAFCVPMLNILAVIALSIFRPGGERPSVKKILLDIIKNPLIQSIVAGVVCLLVRMLFEQRGIAFRLSHIEPIYTAIGYLSNMSTPLALLVLGAQFEFSAVNSMRREIIFGTLMRCAVVPILGVGTAYLFFSSQFDGAHFAAFVAMFTTPVAVSSVPMAQEMDGDVTLAGQFVVWTAIASAFSIFITSFLLKSAGIF